MTDGNITRRDFVRGTVAAALTVAGTRSWAQTRPSRSARVFVIRDAKALDEKHKADPTVVRQMVADALIQVTGQPTTQQAWASLLTPNDIVGLVHSDHFIPTHSEVIDAVRESLMAAGIPAKAIRMAQGGPAKVEACTALVSLPALKAHWLTGIGTVLKNYIMFSGGPSNYHDADSAKIGEIWQLPIVKGKTKIVLVDALRPLCDKGPQPDPRYLWDYRGLIAGTDPVALDTICLKVITTKREALRGEPWPLSPPPLCVAAADEKYGLGTSRISEITIERLGWKQDVLI